MEATPGADDLVTLNRAATIARLLAGVAHEVNNALLVISGTAELLEDPSPAPDALARGLGRIRTQSARAAAAIAEVLAFARDAPDTIGRVNLRETAATAIALRTYAIGRAALTIELRAPDDVPLVVRGNRVLLQQVILNLITNAEQALAGRPRGAIDVELSAKAGRVRVRVSDTGPGVPAAFARGSSSRLSRPAIASSSPGSVWRRATASPPSTPGRWSSRTHPRARRSCWTCRSPSEPRAARRHRAAHAPTFHARLCRPPRPDVCRPGCRGGRRRAAQTGRGLHCTRQSPYACRTPRRDADDAAHGWSGGAPSAPRRGRPFHSLARSKGVPIVGLLLTGMGQDGADGMVALRRAGAGTIAEDEHSCVVFGMPREAIARGSASHVATLLRMPFLIRECFARLAPPGEPASFRAS